ncbi:hypothetical protein BGX24_010042 [Mortierella sp. AD032]|nr:hypothetical protein BGX24_010042 [Mortierella sp. AD032]
MTSMETVLNSTQPKKIVYSETGSGIPEVQDYPRKPPHPWVLGIQDIGDQVSSSPLPIDKKALIKTTAIATTK